MAFLDYQPLEGSITSLIQELHRHEGGYVHGDLRDTNFFVRDDGKHFVLLDFDWAGPVHKTHYPMHVNRQDIRRPECAGDWKEIVPQHDLDMLTYLFHPELGDLEEKTQERPAAKRPCMSSSISSESSMDVF
jgi:serine/threonine protein kinase